MCAFWVSKQLTSIKLAYYTFNLDVFVIDNEPSQQKDEACKHREVTMFTTGEKKTNSILTNRIRSQLEQLVL